MAQLSILYLNLQTSSYRKQNLKKWKTEVKIQIGINAEGKNIES